MMGFWYWLEFVKNGFRSPQIPTLAYMPEGTSVREVAFAYLFGDSVEQDYKKALKWFRMQASENYFFIGACYYKLKKYSTAASYFRKEVAREAYGSQMAMAAHALAECYRKGIGVKQNVEKATKYSLIEGTEGGTARDAYWSGICYLFGLGVSTDVAEGLRLLEMAARQGEDWAWLRLGKIYLEGDFGVEKDTDKAIEYLQRAKRMSGLAAYYLEEARKAKKS